MTKEYMFIETLNISRAIDTIDAICAHNGMDYYGTSYTDFMSLVSQVPIDFPVNDIEHESWFLGYDLKEVFE